MVQRAESGSFWLTGKSDVHLKLDLRLPRGSREVALLEPAHLPAVDE